MLLNVKNISLDSDRSVLMQVILIITKTFANVIEVTVGMTLTIVVECVYNSEKKKDGSK